MYLDLAATNTVCKALTDGTKPGIHLLLSCICLATVQGVFELIRSLVLPGVDQVQLAGAHNAEDLLRETPGVDANLCADGRLRHQR